MKSFPICAQIARSIRRGKSPRITRNSRPFSAYHVHLFLQSCHIPFAVTKENPHVFRDFTLSPSSPCPSRRLHRLLPPNLRRHPNLLPILLPLTHTISTPVDGRSKLHLVSGIVRVLAHFIRRRVLLQALSTAQVRKPSNRVHASRLAPLSIQRVVAGFETAAIARSPVVSRRILGMWEHAGKYLAEEGS